MTLTGFRGSSGSCLVPAPVPQHWASYVLLRVSCSTGEQKSPSGLAGSRGQFFQFGCQRNIISVAMMI